MENSHIRRIYRPLTPEERERWIESRNVAERERPLILAQIAKLYDAASKVGISGDEVREFLMGRNPEVWERLGDTAGLDFPLKFNVTKSRNSSPLTADSLSPIAEPPITLPPSSSPKI